MARRQKMGHVMEAVFLRMAAPGRVGDLHDLQSRLLDLIVAQKDAGTIR
jgi:hypothetical protein